MIYSLHYLATCFYDCYWVFLQLFSGMEKSPSINSTSIDNMEKKQLLKFLPSLPEDPLIMINWRVDLDTHDSDENQQQNE